ncbi:hypothetical protein BC30090_p309 (plasmid) [Bacillus cereus]|nr:hypothetical protein BC30090_p309 [Bacillus cereus]
MWDKVIGYTEIVLRAISMVGTRRDYNLGVSPAFWKKTTLRVFESI